MRLTSPDLTKIENAKGTGHPIIVRGEDPISDRARAEGDLMAMSQTLSFLREHVLAVAVGILLAVLIDVQQLRVLRARRNGTPPPSWARFLII